ncbi:MAG: hypothetical protein KAJ66_06775 [Candidatus Omnitrophica bacterium]|nr:hypothetical protein [Candidatus Omnitrophota bacterium]
MDKTIRVVIIFFASITAFILVLVGIKRLKLNKTTRHSFFVSTLLIILGLTGCDAADKSASSADSSLKPAEIENIKQVLSRVDKLNNTQEWINFKAFWKKLDEITPKQKTDEKEADYFFSEYTGAISNEEAENLRGELPELTNGLKKLEQEEKISTIEIELLIKICRERINYMSYGFTLTRMMPPPVQSAKEVSIKNLERRIDILIELQEKEEIETKEYEQALLNIQEDIKTFSILDAINSHYVRYYYYPGVGSRETGDKVNITERHIKEFEKHYADYQIKKEEGKLNDDAIAQYKDIDVNYRQTKQALAEIKKALPAYGELIVDLER